MRSHVSIHARAKRATEGIRALTASVAVSIHARAKRATERAGVATRARDVSIHARAKRATAIDKLMLWNYTVSIHARAKRATRTTSARRPTPWFQFTPARSGRQHQVAGQSVPLPVSIHARAKRATYPCASARRASCSFNSRPREAGDRRQGAGRRGAVRFNSRPREAGDRDNLCNYRLRSAPKSPAMSNIIPFPCRDCFPATPI